MTSPPSPRPLLKPIGDIAAAHRFHLRVTDEGFCISPPRLPVTINGQWLLDDAVLIYLYCRTTSLRLSGDLTDTNDWFSLLLAAYLRCCPQPFSASLWDVDPPVPDRPTHVYARILSLDQPGHSVIRSDPSSLADFDRLCSYIKQFEIVFPMVCAWTNDDEQSEESLDAVELWAMDVSKAVDETLDHRVQYDIRGPDWLSYRSIQRNISILASAHTVVALQTLLCPEIPGNQIRAINRRLFVSDRVRSATPLRAEQWARKLLAQFSSDIDRFLIVPLENRLIVAGGTHVIALTRDCGEQTFRDERARVERRHRHEARILFHPSGYAWKDRLDPDRFESLVQDLLVRESGVTRVRKVGRTHNPDRGKDLIADWLTAPAAGTLVRANTAPTVAQKIVVQIKSKTKSVGKGDVIDIRDTLDDHQASGYFLAVSSQITSDLTDHLDRMRSEGKYWIDWWNRIEIEERLNAHVDILARYPDLVTRVELSRPDQQSAPAPSPSIPDNTDPTVAYYDRKATDYFQATVDLDMSPARQRFQRYLFPGARLLDAGSGSGRDTLAFLQQGYRMEAFDASRELATLSTKLTGIHTKVATFQDLTNLDRYDGIWASGSLLHVPQAQLPSVLAKCRNALKPGGAFFASFREGQDEHTDPEGRHFTDLTTPALQHILATVPGLTLRESWRTEDKNSAGTLIAWLNVIMLREV